MTTTQTPSHKLQAETVILGFTGSIGSGCTYIAKGLSDQYKYTYYSLSDVLRKIAKDRKEIDKPTPKDLQDLGDELRGATTDSFLVQELFKTITAPPQDDDVIIIDSIRNDGEVKTLKQFPNFYLFSVHADESVRLNRTLVQGKFKTDKEFFEADERDKAEEVHYGQQVKKCNYLADIIINNNINIPKASKKTKKEFIDSLYEKYVMLIKDVIANSLTADNLPSLNETFMTMAYAESQRSSCLKRKVGAIIASIQINERIQPGDKAINEAANVLASGHNEVPFGTIPCIFSEHAKCYRDFLQESKGKKIKYCPGCGHAIKISVKCPACSTSLESFSKSCPECKKEIDAKKFKCESCGINVFDEFLQSGGGKLLDMCKALHAEENAVISLAKIINAKTDLILYTTTYPCNMCANKIVASGIQKVVYADPYPMKEAKEILAAGKVVTEKFQGIKSSAYFRLYNQ